MKIYTINCTIKLHIYCALSEGLTGAMKSSSERLCLIYGFSVELQLGGVILAEHKDWEQGGNGFPGLVKGSIICILFVLSVH